MISAIGGIVLPDERVDAALDKFPLPQGERFSTARGMNPSNEKNNQACVYGLSDAVTAMLSFGRQ